VDNSSSMMLRKLGLTTETGTQRAMVKSKGQTKLYQRKEQEGI
jgi:hypothetical protein